MRGEIFHSQSSSSRNIEVLIWDFRVRSGVEWNGVRSIYMYRERVSFDAIAERRFTIKGQLEVKML